ncbi:MAG: glycosyltransferase family 4 protein [Pirellulaceae bacterium]
MRVLVLCEYPSLNGGEHSLLEAARCFDRRHVELIVAAPPAGPLAAALLGAGWPHLPLVCSDTRGHRLPLSALHERLAELLRHCAPEVVHANSVSMSRLAGPVVQQLKIPGIGHLRDIVKLGASSIAALASHRRLLAVSAATSRWYQGHGLERADIRVEHNGVDLTRFRPRSSSGYLHVQLGIDRKSRLIGTIGQIGLRKGTDVLLSAMSHVARQRPDVHLLVVGQRYSQKDEARAFEERIRRESAGSPLCGRVHWLGVRDDIDLLLNELTIYVHAARQEPLGRVLLESAAAGLAIVATDVGGTREIFCGSPPSALLVPADAVDHLAETVQRLLDSPDLQQDLGRAARRRAESTFNVQQAAQRLAGHYFEVADAGAARRCEV